ncbi:hypothetical protein EMCRGX_G003095 [Ephydatia muelleri]
MTQGHARILNTGPARSMATTTKPYKLFHVPTNRVGVYLRQPRTQRHAWIQNTGGVTTTHKVGVYLRQPRTQRHAWIRNTGGVTTTHKYFQAHQWRWVPFLVGVYLRQPGTQRHAWIRNTGGVTTTHKYFQAHQWRWVPFLVGVYLRQPGTQRHARIRNTGGVTTTHKYFQAHQWRWVSFFTFKLTSGDGCHSCKVCTCTNQGPNVTRGFGTLGVLPQLISTCLAHQWRWVPFLCVPAPTRDPTLRVDPEHWGCDHTRKYFKLTNGDGCYSCELQSTLRQTLNCSMYPQGSPVQMYFFGSYFVMPPIRRKHNFEPGALVKYIADTGETPPKDASCNGPSGYWYLAAQVLSGKSNPSFKFVAAVASYWYHNRSDLCVQNKIGASHHYQTCTRNQAVLVTEGKVADRVQEDTSTHLDGEIKEERANDVETVGEGPSNSEHQDGVDQGPSDGVDEGSSDGVDEGSSDGVDEGPSDGVDEGPSDGVDEGPSDGVDEGPSDGVDEGSSDGSSDGVEDEGPSDGVDEGPSDGVDDESSDGVDEGPSDGVDEGPSDGVDEGPSDGVDEGPSGGVDEGVNEGPSDGVDERPSDGTMNLILTILRTTMMTKILLASSVSVKHTMILQGFIQFIHASPFGVICFNEAGVRLYHEVAKYCPVFCDATGSIVAIPSDCGIKSTVYYYCLVVKHPVYNLETIQDYLLCAFRIVTGAANSKDIDKVLPHACTSHVMNSAKKNCKTWFQKELYSFAMYSFSSLVNSTTLNELELRISAKYLKEFTTSMVKRSVCCSKVTSEKSSWTVMTISAKGQCGDKSLMEILNNWIDSFLATIEGPQIYCERCNSKLTVQESEVVFPSVLILHCSRVSDHIRARKLQNRVRVPRVCKTQRTGHYELQSLVVVCPQAHHIQCIDSLNVINKEDFDDAVNWICCETVVGNDATISSPDFKNNPDQDDIFATPWGKEHYLKYFPRQTRPSDRRAMAVIRTYLFVFWAAVLVISEARRLRDKELNDEQEGTKYAIRSLSSGRFLDGRNPGMYDPILSDGSRTPSSDTYLQWIISPISNTDNLFSIRSVSSNRLLDGRNPGMSEVIISDGNRNPETDVYLQWKMVKLTELTYALLSQSSGQYLDGRNPDLITPILSSGSRDPHTDMYLQFLIVPLE